MKIIDKTYSKKFKDIDFRAGFKHGISTYIKCDNKNAFNINSLLVEHFPDNTLVVPVRMALFITDKDVEVHSINYKCEEDYISGDIIDED